jgi:hypothetical protein
VRQHFHSAQGTALLYPHHALPDQASAMPSLKHLLSGVRERKVSQHSKYDSGMIFSPRRSSVNSKYCKEAGVDRFAADRVLFNTSTLISLYC